MILSNFTPELQINDPFFALLKKCFSTPLFVFLQIVKRIYFSKHIISSMQTKNPMKIVKFDEEQLEKKKFFIKKAKLFIVSPIAVVMNEVLLNYIAFSYFHSITESVIFNHKSSSLLSLKIPDLLEMTRIHPFFLKSTRS